LFGDHAGGEAGSSGRPERAVMDGVEVRLNEAPSVAVPGCDRNAKLGIRLARSRAVGLDPSSWCRRGNMQKLDMKVAHHPAVLQQFEQRTADIQLRIADKITAFAGSMNFVYLHVLLFATWMIVFEKSPWPTLTLIVSLEAIFLSTFVMIGQNRQAAFQQAKSDHDYQDVEKLLIENTDLTRAINRLTEELHHRLLGDQTSSSPEPPERDARPSES
jgi:uncharacterized membrane protein